MFSSLSLTGLANMVCWYFQQVPWWQSAAFGNAMIGLIVALAGWITFRVEGNAARSKQIEKNTNSINTNLQATVTAQSASIIADKDKQIAALQSNQTGGTKA